MAKGAQAKQEIINKLLSIFEGSFLCEGGKELRIPMIENGEQIQIKCALTCAKVNVEPSGGSSSPAPSLSNIPSGNFEITEEEKKETIDLIEKLGL